MDTCVGSHEILNHRGEIIRVTRKALRGLDMRNYLKRNRETGMLQIKPEYYLVYLELECGDRPSFIYKELGRDMRGASTVACKCRDCQREAGQTDNTPIPGSRSGMTHADVTALVRNAIMKRKFA